MPGPLRIHKSIIDRAGSLYIQWKTPRNAGKVLVLVEGWEDALVYDSLFDAGTASLKDCGGCNDAVGIGTKLKVLAPKQKIVTILDSDFRFFYGRNRKKSSLFFTDAHDMETMILFTPQLFQTTISYLKCPNVMHQDIVRDLRLLSYIRWYNQDAKMKFTDKNLDIVNLSQNKISDYDYIMSFCFVPTSGTTKQWLKRCFVTFKSKFSRARADHLLNGHDYIDRFCYYARLRNRIQLSSEDVLLGIAFSCNGMWFKSTKLGKNIMDWESRNGVLILS